MCNNAPIIFACIIKDIFDISWLMTRQLKHRPSKELLFSDVLYIMKGAGSFVLCQMHYKLPFALETTLCCPAFISSSLSPQQSTFDP